MKPKYNGFLVAAIFVFTMGLVGVFDVNPNYSGSIGPKSGPPVNSGLDIALPPRADIQTAARLTFRMGDLVHPPEARESSADLRLFGVGKMVQGSGKKGIRRSKSNFTGDASLTFTFASGRKRFCMINGAFRALGDSLPSGDRIVKIESNRVMVQRGQSSRWIGLAEKPETPKKTGAN